jgi:hypothetical protein
MMEAFRDERDLRREALVDFERRVVEPVVTRVEFLGVMGSLERRWGEALGEGMVA